jgi:hypothetical protein
MDPSAEDFGERVMQYILSGKGLLHSGACAGVETPLFTRNLSSAEHDSLTATLVTPVK